ncbi:hypothetical protein [Dyella sp. 20L07]|uniref:hypothetical protein n=1 Tax=Dyella sp. 20L07 TaxID=3384240 RepID=UPI003D2DB305
MCHRRLSIALFAITLFATTAHAAHSGSIEFRGRIFAPASAFMANQMHNQAHAMQMTHTQTLAEARVALSVDALNYFATYARGNAALVSATYQ